LIYPTTLDTASFGSTVHQHVHMIRHDVPLLDPTLLLLGQPVKRLPKVTLDHPVELPPPIFRYEHNVILALPSAMIQVLGVFHVSFGLWL
jgi:hypothetical protein